MPTERLRVLVAGDSTSIGAAEALFTAGNGTVDVLSIGRDACPLVSTSGVRWGSNELDVSECPRIESDWASYLDRFHPDVVLLVASLMEQSDQRYVGDDSWHEPGDPAYVAHHDDFMTQLQAVVGTSIPIAVTDGPPIAAGNFSGSEMARPERVAAWNAVLTSWAATWPNVHVLPYAQGIATLEGAEPGSQRPDGVHLSPQGAQQVAATVILPALRDLAIAPPAT